MPYEDAFSAAARSALIYAECHINVAYLRQFGLKVFLLVLAVILKGNFSLTFNAFKLLVLSLKSSLDFLINFSLCLEKDLYVFIHFNF